MAKKSVSDLEFEFGEDGELELAGFDVGDTFEEEEELLDDNEIEEEEEVEEEEEDSTPDLDARVNSIEKTLQALPQMIATSISSALNGVKAKEEEEEEIPEELDNKQIVNILAKRMEKVVKKEVGDSLNSRLDNDPAIREARLTAEFRACFSEFGKNFQDRMIPVAQIVQRVEKAGGKISVKDAYLSIKDMAIPESKKRSDKVSKKPVRVDADSRDSVGEVPIRPKFDSKKIKETSDTDMFRHAWNSALLTTAKRGARRAG